jgi:hypothetical protein
VRFSYRMVPEVYQVFWAGMAAGEFINDAAIAAGSYRKQGARWLAAVPRRGRNLMGRCLTLAQREEIALGRARGDSIRAIAAIIGRSPSTVSRELRRNADGLGRYRATSAHALAYHRASRPKPAKLLTNLNRSGGSSARGRSASEEPDPEHDQHCRAAGRGRRPGRPRPLGIQAPQHGHVAVAPSVRSIGPELRKGLPRGRTDPAGAPLPGPAAVANTTARDRPADPSGPAHRRGRTLRRRCRRHRRTYRGSNRRRSRSR